MSRSEAGALGGKGTKADSNTTCLDRGSTYTLRRLKRDSPELAAQVAAGKLSANAAAIQAGFREPVFSVSMNPERAASAILKRFAAEEVQRLIRALSA